MKNGFENVLPPSVERTNRYWFSSGVLKFSNATPRNPVVGCTVGVENWLLSQLFATPNAQKDALPLIGFCGDHERPWSSEWLSMMFDAVAVNFVHVTYTRSGLIGLVPHAVGVCAAVKHCAAMRSFGSGVDVSSGRGPAAMYSLSSNGTLLLIRTSLSRWNEMTPSPGRRGSPGPPQAVVVTGSTMQARLHV